MLLNFHAKPAMMIRSLTVAIVWTACLPAMAVAQSTVRDAEPPTTYEIKVGVDGRLEISPTEQVGEDSEQTIAETFKGVQETWLRASTPDGGEYLVQSAPSEEQLGGLVSAFPMGTKFTTLASEEVYEQIAKVSVRQNISRLRRGEIVDVINDMVQGAQEQVCGLAAKPKEFAVSANVQIGVGASGGVTFSATWETTELCEALLSQKD